MESTTLASGCGSSDEDNWGYWRPAAKAKTEKGKSSVDSS